MMSKILRCQSEPPRLTSTGDLEQVILFKLLEHASFDLDELVRHEKREKRMVV